MTDSGIKAIVTDIEGTTTDLAFVQEVLFPYSRQQLPDYIKSHAGNPEVEQQLDAICREYGMTGNVDAINDFLLQCIAKDLKLTPLKALQGLVWEYGYKNGDFTGHIYPDAADQLRLWNKQGIDLYVYSSGSVHAQQLLFRYSSAGDLSTLFKGYFDTRTGAKKASTSYWNISRELAISGSQILFLSDSLEELDAAKAAGFHTTAVCRGETGLDFGQHPQAANFNEIDLAHY